MHRVEALFLKKSYSMHPTLVRGAVLVARCIRLEARPETKCASLHVEGAHVQLKRQRVTPCIVGVSKALYIGSIMAKFAALEKAQGAASGAGAGASGSGGGGGGGGGSGGSPPKLTEEELVKAVGGGHASFNDSRSAAGTDYSLVEEQNFENTQRLKPRGALIGGLTAGAYTRSHFRST